MFRLIALMALLGAPIAFISAQNGVPTPSVPVQFFISAAKAELEVACVEYLNSSGESEGFRLYFSQNSYPKALEFENQKLTTTRLQTGTCKQDLTYIMIYSRATREEIISSINRKGGFKKANVIFYNSNQVSAAYLAALIETFNQL